MLAEINYDGQLSGSAYLILTLIFLIIFGGLGWCFYRALSVSSQQEADQLPDEV